MLIKDVLVLIADGTPDSSGECVNISEVTIPEESVPVSFDTNGCISRLVAMAKLYKKGNKVYADMQFLDTEESRLAQVLNPYPSVAGKITNRLGLDNKFIRCSVEQIMLSVERNSDERIPKLKA